jgi:hypothetical protein
MIDTETRLYLKSLQADGDIAGINALARALARQVLSAAARLQACYGVAFPHEVVEVWSIYKEKIGFTADFLLPFNIIEAGAGSFRYDIFIRDRELSIRQELNFIQSHPGWIPLLFMRLPVGPYTTTPRILCYHEASLARAGDNSVFEVPLKARTAPRKIAQSLCGALIHAEQSTACAASLGVQP